METRNTNSSKLIRLQDRLYVYPFEKGADRPNLYYVKGDERSLAVDAGNSPAHVRAFYAALAESGLPLPEMTIISHWHWDHTFGLCAIAGKSLSSRLTHEKLIEVSHWKWDLPSMKQREQTGEDIAFCNQNILEEYPDLDIRVVTTDQIVDGPCHIDLGGVEVELIPKASTHGDDSMFIYLPQQKALIVEDADCEDFYDGYAYDRAKLEDMIAFFGSMDYEHHYLGHAEEESKSQALERLNKVLETL